MSSADECNLRCAQEERCLFTSFVKMTNGGKERCYLFEHGALVLFNKVKGNGDNIKEGKVSIFSSKLKGTSGIEAIGLQVGFFFKSIKEVLGETDHSSTPKDEGQHTCTVLQCLSKRQVPNFLSVLRFVYNMSKPGPVECPCSATPDVQTCLH